MVAGHQPEQHFQSWRFMAGLLNGGQFRFQSLTARELVRISHRLSTAAADPGMSAALLSVALAWKRQMRLVSMPVCAASLRNPVRKAG